MSGKGCFFNDRGAGEAEREAREAELRPQACNDYPSVRFLPVETAVSKVRGGLVVAIPLLISVDFHALDAALGERKVGLRK